jgi:3-dehydroquinate synthase
MLETLHQPAQRDMRQVRVNLGPRSYTIHVGEGLAERCGDILGPLANGRPYAIVADEAVRAIAESAAAHLKANGLLLGPVIYVAGGEASKSFATLEQVCAALLAFGVERSHGVIAIGGGVIGDLAGFAAAILKRGVRLVQVPTTLLAQVDSSVGGKTGINTAQGKNLIGAFHQPAAVLIDPQTLQTLPQREFRAGYAEIVKYALLGDAAFFEWLNAHHDSMHRQDPSVLRDAIVTSCRMKAGIVERDELESGERALLNLGHTFGHAIEAWAGYSGAVLHGEAVALGMVLAAEFSERKGLCARGVARRLADHLRQVGLPADFTALRSLAGGRMPSPDVLIEFMAHDKKVTSGQFNLVLLRGIGAAFVARDVPVKDVRDFLCDRLA